MKFILGDLLELLDYEREKQRESGKSSEKELPEARKCSLREISEIHVKWRIRKISHRRARAHTAAASSSAGLYTGEEFIFFI